MNPQQKAMILEKRAAEKLERQAVDYLESCGFDFRYVAGTGKYFLSDHATGDWLDGGRLFNTLQDAARFIRERQESPEFRRAR